MWLCDSRREMLVVQILHAVFYGEPCATAVGRPTERLAASVEAGMRQHLSQWLTRPCMNGRET